MSSMIRKSVGDLPSSTANFSYAQAAKGRSSSLHSSAPATGPDPTVKESMPTIPTKSTTQLETLKSPENQKTDSDGHKENEELRSDNIGEKTTTVIDTQSNDMSTSEHERHPQSPASRTSASNVVTPSVARSEKEVEISPTQPNPTDLPWDSFSQTSNKTDKASQPSTADPDKEHEKDEWKETQSAFVAAPVPAVNVWQQRKEAQAAKAKAMAQSSAQSSPGSKAPPTLEKSNEKSAASNKPPTGDKGSDVARADSKRRGRTGPNESGITESEGAASQSMPRTRNSISGKPKDDVFKKPLPRQRSSPEKERVRDGSAPQAPPPVADSMSWPTPESAKDEERRKAQGKNEKSDKERNNATGTKPHGKEKWTPVPYTPTVVFETQLSPRGPMRPGRGGRDAGRGRGHFANGSVSGERAFSGPGTPVMGAGTEDPGTRGRGDSNATKPTPSSIKSPKRAVSAGPQVGREQRKSVSMPSASEKRKEPETASSKNAATNSPRRVSIPPQGVQGAQGSQGESNLKARQEPRQQTRGESGTQLTVITGGPERSNSTAHDNHTQTKSAGYDRRGEGPSRYHDHPREVGHHGTQRERGDARLGQGRGGFRGGRGGGGNGFSSTAQHPSSTFSNGAQPHNSNSSSFVAPKNPAFNPYNQHQHGRQVNDSRYAPGPPPHPRTNRRESHSPSRPTSTAFSRYTGIPNAHQQISPIQTQMGPMYEYQALQAMSAMPYTPYVEQYSVLSMVSMQLEYYFSVDNLCKDMFLRKHMDSQGFVFLNVIANFNRIRNLTQDIELLRVACYQSRTIEFVQGSDGLDRVRRREGWQQWLLAMEERDPSVRTDGLGQPQRVPRDDAQEIDPHQVGSSRQSISSNEMPRDHDHTVNNPPHSTHSGPASNVAPSSNAPSRNGATNGDSKTTHPTLSASVPEFSPKIPFPSSQVDIPLNGSRVADTFSDREVDNLVLVVRNPTESDMPPPLIAARTFSNGSIDQKTLADSFGEHPSGPEGRRNGPHEGYEEPNSQANSPKKPKSPSSPPRVFWMKDCENPTGSLPDNVYYEHYISIRNNALRQRELSIDGVIHRDMIVLYQFWSHFLVRNFNTRMYNEFHCLALVDHFERHSDVGLRHLVQYYDVSINGPKTVSDTLAKHFVELVAAEERSDDRIAFNKLKLALQNGDLNLKTRRKIEDLLGEDLKLQLTQ
ncbi:MAG: hypothetical protein M1816_002581 [Peltula sp. TS41687]|nr:MAG: hypothetical protein M1816_002581 [Peltula sp. TS41687]